MIDSQLALIQIDMLASVFQASVVKANYSQGNFVEPQHNNWKQRKRINESKTEIAVTMFITQFFLSWLGMVYNEDPSFFYWFCLYAIYEWKQKYHNKVL